MRWVVFVLLIALCFMLVVCYSLLVMASESDDEAERMYREWKEREDERLDRAKIR